MNRIKLWYNEFVIWLYKHFDKQQYRYEDTRRYFAYRNARIAGWLTSVPVSREEFMNLYPPEGGPEGWKPECESAACVISKRQKAVRKRMGYVV